MRTVHAIMTAAYWETGRRVVEYEQKGQIRAEYGVQLLARLSADLSARLGRGYGVDNLQRMRTFYVAYPPEQIYATLSRKSNSILTSVPGKYATTSRKLTAVKTATEISPCRPFTFTELTAALPLSWSHYVLLLKARSPEARAFYETEALRGGWPVRTLDRQMSTLFYERTALSHDKVALLRKHAKARPGEETTADEAVKDPLILEFLQIRGTSFSSRNLPNISQGKLP